jgi:hypothetical protein
MPSVGGDIDEYFDRLDAAFATLTEAPVEQKPQPPAAGQAAPPSAQARGSSQFDWFGNSRPEPSGSPDRFRAAPPPPADEPADLPLAAGGRGLVPADLDVGPALRPSSSLRVPTPAAMLDSASLQHSIPDVASLDLEPPLLDHPPVLDEPTAMQPPAAIDLRAIVDEVTERVLDRLSERVGREMVVDVVTSVAVRLVREEIERIKASIT